MRKFIVIFGLVVAAAIILPWVAAYRCEEVVRYSYGRIDGRQVECVAVDGIYFDRYFCLVFDGSLGARVSNTEGRIFLDGRPVEFPPGQNVGFVQPDGRVQYVAATAQDIAPADPGDSEIYYLFGRIPKRKHFAFGTPREEFVGKLFQSLK
jgi:hypothetical protein